MGTGESVKSDLKKQRRMQGIKHWVHTARGFLETGGLSGTLERCCDVKDRARS